MPRSGDDRRMTLPPNLVLRPVTADVDLERYAAIINETQPEDATTLAEIHWADTTYPGGVRVLAELDGVPVGAASVGRIYMYGPDHPGWWGTIGVLEPHRRRGIGEALLRAISDAARDAGKTELQLRGREDRPEGIDFLAHRGFTELERSKMVTLSLDGLAMPDVATIEGVSVTTLAADPGLVAGVYDVALEAFADIPGGEDEMAAGDLAEFRARDVDRAGIPKDAFFVAVADDEARTVVGYASLMMLPGSSTRAYHDMTAVRRDWRGRGIATALKRLTIAWAIANGLTELETGNDEDNLPMRAVNARLDYRPMPDDITMRGPLFGGIMEP